MVLNKYQSSWWINGEYFIYTVLFFVQSKYKISKEVIRPGNDLEECGRYETPVETITIIIRFVRPKFMQNNVLLYSIFRNIRT